MTLSYDKLEEIFEDEAHKMLTIPEADDAIIGISEVKYPDSEICHVVTYSRSRLIEVLMREYKIPEDEIEDYIGVNIEGMYSGRYTPIIVDDMLDLEE